MLPVPLHFSLYFSYSLPSTLDLKQRQMHHPHPYKEAIPLSQTDTQLDLTLQRGTAGYRILEFLAATDGVDSIGIRRLARVVSEQEWSDRKLSPQTMELLELKGSPKLTKQLTKMGLKEEVIALALGAPSGVMPHVPHSRILVKNIRDIEEQGNSIHFDSCQATDPRSKGGVKPECVDIEGDKIHYGDTLFLWVVGERMEIDGEGFKARAKLRVMFKDEAAKHPAGLYIDTIYGQQELLLRELPHLDSWWKEYSTTRRWPSTPLLTARHSLSAIEADGPELEKLYCPSAMNGYLDTLKRGYAAHQPPMKQLKVPTEFPSLVRSAFKLSSIRVKSPISGESREHTEHIVPRSAFSYNPQRSDALHVRGGIPEVLLWRGPIPKELHEPLQSLFKALGYPVTRVTFRTYSSYEVKYRNEQGGEIEATFLKKDNRSPCTILYRSSPDSFSKTLLSTYGGKREVRDNLEEFGFAKAVSLSPVLHASLGRALLLEYKGMMYLCLKMSHRTAEVIKEVETADNGRSDWSKFLERPFSTFSGQPGNFSLRCLGFFTALHVELAKLLYRAVGRAPSRLGVLEQGETTDLKIGGAHF